jgi:hypothetical protein
VSRSGKDAIILEPKDNFKDREGYSPDLMDALMLTFAYPVQRAEDSGRAAYNAVMGRKTTVDYDPLERAHNEYEVALNTRIRSEYDPFAERIR